MHSGDVQIKLTQASMDAVKLIPEIETWAVGPTMQRGQKRNLEEKPNTFTKRVAARRAKSKTHQSHCTKKKSQKGTGAVGQKPAPADHSSDAQFTAESFKRNNDGRAAIRSCFRKLQALDAQIFPKKLAFDSMGVCRLNNVPKMTLEECVEALPATLDVMLLGMS